MVGKTNVATSVKGVPEFTYTGTYETIDDGNENWRIKFKTSGTLTFKKLNGVKKGIDVFLVGGGGSGGNNLGAGGGGGYTKTVTKTEIRNHTEYAIVVGGSNAASTAFGETANAGAAGATNQGNGGAGGSGGGAAGINYTNPGGGGSNGGNGGNAQYGGSYGGSGQGTSTREFWDIDHDSSATLYSGGGGGGCVYGDGGSGGSGGGGRGGSRGGELGGGYPASPGTANTGGGGGGGRWQNGAGGAGGSGIVIIRNHKRFQ